MGTNGIAQPGKKGKVTAIILVIVLLLCVSASTWLAYQWNRGLYYGYITIDDPSMTFVQKVGDIISYNEWQVQVKSMHFVKKKGITFLVVHVRINKNTSDPTSLTDDAPGGLIVYTSPVFEGHVFTGNEIDPVPSGSASSFDIGELGQMTMPMNGTTFEGDILFKVPSHMSFVLVLTPASALGEYAWNSTIPDCKFFPVFQC